MRKTSISDVTDTAAWVASYRANESARSDALFRDPLANRLAGELGAKIAATTPMIGAEWYVVIRTCIIDRFIQDSIRDGVDMVINLGAGLDTRPYRLDLPADLTWVEVDYEKIIKSKTEKLRDVRPVCQLERIALDLSLTDARKALFQKLNAQTKKALILTEGVLPYLAEEHVAALAHDLHAQSHFKLWIVDYFSPQFMKLAARGSRKKDMVNAPFLFAPRHWADFFRTLSWQIHSMKYMADESRLLGRTPPYPPLLRFIFCVLPSFCLRFIEKMSGFALLESVD
ncbi:MAG: class I SAM-dependent methyltransferase [Chitinophagaceae bacterium]|nr:class I SAM-dependent methyltransferase [Oligoflexus sp.]